MSNVENVCPQVLRGVARELHALAARPLPGIKLQLRDGDLTDVVAHIDGPAETPYFGGTFAVRLSLGRGFPAAPPRAHFLTKVFHPNVSGETGEVCVDTLSREWRPELGLQHALLALKCLLIAPNPESALNAEAAALLRDDYHEYFARAQLLADIHARPHTRTRTPRAQDGEGEGESEGGGDGVADGPSAKRERRAPASAPAPAHSRAPHKDKRRILKRL